MRVVVWSRHRLHFASGFGESSEADPWLMKNKGGRRGPGWSQASGRGARVTAGTS